MNIKRRTRGVNNIACTLCERIKSAYDIAPNFSQFILFDQFVLSALYILEIARKTSGITANETDSAHLPVTKSETNRYGANRYRITPTQDARAENHSLKNRYINDPERIKVDAKRILNESTSEKPIRAKSEVL